MLSTNVFNEMCVKITLLRYITTNLTGLCNAVYFRLCIDLMHILPPVTAEGFDGSHHPRCVEWLLSVTTVVEPTVSSYGDNNDPGHKNYH